MNRVHLTGMALLVLGLLAGPGATGALAAVIDGTLTAGSPTWDRIREGGADSYNNGVPYAVYQVAANTGFLSVTVEPETAFDSFLALYSDFDPAAPAANLVASNDDGGGYPHARLNNVPVTPAVTYRLVVTSYSAGSGALFPALGTFRMTVEGGSTSSNTPPQIDGTPDPAAARNTLYSFTPTAGDVDAGDTLTFSIENAPPGSSFDSASGTLEWTPTGDQVGQSFADIVIAVSDGTNPEVALEPFTIAVTAFPEPAGSGRSVAFGGAATTDDDGSRGALRAGAIGDEVAVYDGGGTLCGHGVLTVAGQYALTVYGDDPATPGVDEGAAEGEALNVRFWDGQRRRELPVRVLDAGGGRSELTFSAGGGGTLTLHGLAQDRIGTFQAFGNELAAWFRDADNNGAWSPEGVGGLDLAPAYYGSYAMTPVAGDWNGDGFTEIGTYENGQWYLDMNGNGAWDGPVVDWQTGFGTSAMTPVIADWDGDGDLDIGAYENGQWYIDLNNNGVWDGHGSESGLDLLKSFGTSAMTPVVADWDGDGLPDAGAYENGQWYLDLNGSGAWEGPPGDRQMSFGAAGMVPVVGDWNGDGLPAAGVYDGGAWYLDSDGDGAWSGGDTFVPNFGIAGDKPVAGVWR